MTGLSGTDRVNQNEWRTQHNGQAGAVFENSSGRGNTDWSGVGKGHWMIQNPKNPLRSFHSELFFTSRPNLTLQHYSLNYDGFTVDIGGIKMERVDGGNFKAGTRLTLIGYNKS